MKRQNAMNVEWKNLSFALCLFNSTRQTTKQCQIKIDHDGSIARIDHVQWLSVLSNCYKKKDRLLNASNQQFSIVICSKSLWANTNKKKYITFNEVNEGSKAFENIYQTAKTEWEKKIRNPIAICVASSVLRPPSGSDPVIDLNMRWIQIRIPNFNIFQCAIQRVRAYMCRGFFLHLLFVY